MNESPRILVIDDETLIHDLVAEALDDSYALTSVENGEDALVAARNEHPDLILVDVDMPGMDGYETCRRFKEMDGLDEVPVMFISGHDKIEDKLKGYEAGGADYVIKPFNLMELKAKIDHLLYLSHQKKQLKESVGFATDTAMTAMSSMGEMGVLLETIKSFNACLDYESLADAALAGLAQYGLRGATQIRAPGVTLTRSQNGEASPLEKSVIRHMSGMDRINQFKSRLSVNYPHVSLLINDMPLSDADRCGRLRDHLAMLMEAMAAPIQAIAGMAELQKRRAAIERAVASITRTLNEIDSSQRHSQVATRVAVDAMVDTVNRALLKVALTDEQDRFLAATVQHGIESILNAQSEEIDLQNKLTEIIRELKLLAETNEGGSTFRAPDLADFN